MLHRVFVYGTLKKGQPNNCVLHEVKTGTRNYLGDGVSEDRYPLVISSRYNIPFMLNAPNSEGAKNIRGEVYEVDDAVLKALDELEVHPDFYRRETINIRLLGEREDNTLQCLCYLLNDYRPEMLQIPFLESYDAFGEHGLRYIPSNNRDCKQSRGHFWYEVKTSCQKPG